MLVLNTTLTSLLSLSLELPLLSLLSLTSLSIISSLTGQSPCTCPQFKHMVNDTNSSTPILQSSGMTQPSCFFPLKLIHVKSSRSHSPDTSIHLEEPHWQVITVV